MITSPVIVTLKGKPEMGEGILINVETLIEPATDETGQVVRDAQGGLTMTKRREGLVCWLDDRSQIFSHPLEELEWVEVVAVRTYEEMKDEVTEAVLDALEEADEDAGEGDEPEVNGTEPDGEEKE